MVCSGNKGQDVCLAGVQGLPGRGLDKAVSEDGAGFMAKATPGEGESLSHGLLLTSFSRGAVGDPALGVTSLTSFSFL